MLTKIGNFIVLHTKERRNKFSNETGFIYDSTG